MGRLSTRHVVVGLLVGRASYGYRLACDIQERLAFLGLGESAVYKTIERLEADGWIEEVGEHRIGRTRRGAPRVLYRATDQGVEQFRRWMAQPSDRALMRDELHAKLALSEPDDLPALLGTAERQIADCLDDLAALARPALGDLRADDMPWGRLAQMMVDDFRARSLEGLIDWLNDLCVILERRIEAARPDGGGPR